MLENKTDLASLLKDPTLLVTKGFLAGNWVDGEEEATFDVYNPARGDAIAKVADLSRVQAAEAIAAAEGAQKNWAALIAKERSIILRNWFNLMIENADDLAILLTAEQGATS